MLHEHQAGRGGREKAGEGRKEGGRRGASGAFVSTCGAHVTLWTWASTCKSVLGPGAFDFAVTLGPHVL
jgi:hypothetical protein